MCHPLFPRCSMSALTSQLLCTGACTPTPTFKIQYKAPLLDTPAPRPLLRLAECACILWATPVLDSRLKHRCHGTDCVPTMPVPIPPSLRASRVHGAALDSSFPSLSPITFHSSPSHSLSPLQLPLLSALPISHPLLNLFPVRLLLSLASRLVMRASTLSESCAAGDPNRALLGDTHLRLRSADTVPPNAASRLRHARCKIQALPYNFPGPYRLQTCLVVVEPVH
ncbi:hypothetical protein DFH08DRAFT_820282 [Mycena albidolilacea]|uniref:Uncharacterized protein n=1 Tax=Mycena albidolilacea TaxID=1033008 RepID=A0AAD6ZCM0_9AGAR|nr:hypothetical protein DFH08DRAFT_820282 [Mycena albidolilacea]